MKKVYEAPAVEKVEFQYRDQVVVASGGGEPPIAELYKGSTGYCEYDEMDNQNSVIPGYTSSCSNN